MFVPYSQFMHFLFHGITSLCSRKIIFCSHHSEYITCPNYPAEFCLWSTSGISYGFWWFVDGIDIIWSRYFPILSFLLGHGVNKFGDKLSVCKIYSLKVFRLLIESLSNAFCSISSAWFSSTVWIDAFLFSCISSWLLILEVDIFDKRTRRIDSASKPQNQ